jgi:hypothetical protein
MASKEELLDALDHPIFFVLVMTMAVISMMAIFTYLAKTYQLPGLASLVQHP